MKGVRSFKQKVAEVLRLWQDMQYDRALGEVEELLQEWPGNAKLHVMWASLVQLQEKPTHTLDEAKQALQLAVDLDNDSPVGHVELGHFLDAVEDNPRAAAKAFGEAVVSARRLLIDGLLGRAKALLELNKREEASRCLMESLYLAGVDESRNGVGSRDAVPDVLLRDAVGGILGFHLQGPFATRIEELLKAVLLNRSA